MTALQQNEHYSMRPDSQVELIPYLSVRGCANAIEFYSKVFNVEPVVRLEMPDGRIMHCEFLIGSARLYLSDELPEHGGTPSPVALGNSTVAIHMRVENCDDLVKTMSENGSEILMEPEDMFWGERFARVRDPFGHEWGISTVIREMTPVEIQDAAAAMFAKMSGDS